MGAATDTVKFRLRQRNPKKATKEGGKTSADVGRGAWG